MDHVDVDAVSVIVRYFRSENHQFLRDCPKFFSLRCMNSNVRHLYCIVARMENFERGNGEHRVTGCGKRLSGGVAVLLMRSGSHGVRV